MVFQKRVPLFNLHYYYGKQQKEDEIVETANHVWKVTSQWKIILQILLKKSNFSFSSGEEQLHLNLFFTLSFLVNVFLLLRKGWKITSFTDLLKTNSSFGLFGMIPKFWEHALVSM